MTASTSEPEKASPTSAPETRWRRKVTRSLLSLSMASMLSTVMAAPEASAQFTLPPSDTAAKTPAASTPASAAKPLAVRRTETLKLVAAGRAALDKGDVKTAYQLANQAQTLGVKEHEFQAGDARPWQLLLDAQAAARRTGLDLNALAKQPANPIMQTSGTAAAGTGFVQQAGGASTLPGGVSQVQATSPLGGGNSDGDRLYREGMDLLSQGKKTEARQAFVKAWTFESELDTETRRALKDKLTLLQPSRLPSPAAGQPMTAMDKAELEAQQQTRRLYREVTTELSKANEKRTNAPMDAVDDLERLRRRVEGASIDEASKASLAAMVDRALTDQKTYVEQHRAEIELDLANEAVRTEMANDAAKEARLDDEISSLVETFNDLMDDRRFHEAEVIAKQVGELKPGSPIAQSMFHSSRMGVRIQMDEEIQAGSEDGFVREMLAIGRAAVPPDPDRPFSFPEIRSWEELSRRRLSSGAESSLSPREQEIKRRLATEVEVKYNNRPLGDVLDDLSTVTGVPIVIDNRALAAIRLNRETPVSQNISTRISLESALNIILGDLDLTHVIGNEVLNVTSKEARRTMVEQRTYRVADLVTPIPNFVSGYDEGLRGALRSAYQMINPQTDVQVVPVSASGLSGFAGNNANAGMQPNMLGQYSPGGGFATAGGLGSPNAFGAQGGQSMADFSQLMQLIQTTIEPESWEALGGVGTMAPYPQNLSLVVSTTSDVHDQIVDLLESLRRLQNLQITIEVRFITLSDTFFEQIGVDFDLQFDDNAPGLPGDDSGPEVTIGLDPDGTPTADLDIRLDNNVSGVVAPFGAPDAGAISTLGFAILSDIEAYFFLQAAQGDSRTNVMQAPKVTLFDGQIASISDQTQRPFVTSIVPVVGDFAVAQQPVIVVLDEGTRLNVQGVVSEDKRFVRLTLIPTFSQIGEVNEFTFQGNSTTRNSSNRNVDTNGDGVVDEEDEQEEESIVQGTTVQQPTFAFTNVSTTVSVPDGGTILLGGIKRMSEGRNERGLPFLSKIPYVSRLFRNTAVGRQSSSLMMMVTPRIIIQEEEEIAQTGFDPGR
ncbi:type II secretion system protein GspD [Rhodopirellula halodulae]|uniref:type II secretion system protein GspD n=1 Tax=Rhodopirellula halodulae TaxID=2894198 RepID=UPI0036F26CD9